MNEIAVMSGLPIEHINRNVIEKFLEQLPEKALGLGIRVLLSIIVFLIGIQLIKVLRKIVKKSLERAGADTGVVQFLDSFIKFSLYGILLVMIAAGFGVDATGIMALLGSAGVAIGLAVQGSLSNFVGGVLILVLKPFRVGDYIKEDGHNNEGEVKEISLFYTKLATVDNKVIVLPNGTLANASLTNATASDSRRMDMLIGISYQADLRQAKAVLMEVLEQEEAVQKDKDYLVYVDQLAVSAVNIGVRCWFSREDFWQAKWRLTENIKYALDDAGIEIPYPQMDIHMKNG